MRRIVFGVLGTIVAVFLALLVWLSSQMWEGRAHAMKLGNIALGAPVDSLDRTMGKAPDCRYLIASHEVRYYLSPERHRYPPPGCSPQGTRLEKWDDLPTLTYEAIVVSISARGRVEAKELTGETSLYTLPDSRLPEGAATIGCCGAQPTSQ